MQYRVFAIPATGSTDLEEDLNRFLRSHKVITVQKTVEMIDGAPRWCFCVEYIEGASPSGAGTNAFSGKSKRVDYKEVLSENDFSVYARLREVRKELAAAEAVPVYTVCTNEHLAAMAVKRPESLSDLKEIDGFGEAKAAKYGKALLSVLNRNEADEESG
ncbi:MAG TPA: HRDC domain-containing protein [Candidatus Hydrogenedentes bacterium]|nr:HRDC domain-containing protein [Candidatus Hydrogenedentota bacterium]